MLEDYPRFSRPFLSPPGGEIQQGKWCPAADVYRTREGWLVKLELAGVRQDEIRLTLHERRLTIVGIRRDSAFDENCECYSLEISYSQFERRIELPCNLERARIVTEYRDGMLIARVITEGAGS